MKLKSIKVFEQNERLFTYNGLGIVYPSSCVIKRNLPDMTYSLELECIIDNNGKWKLFETGRIIVAKNQPFRIGIIEHDPISRTMKVYAEHIFFDLQNNFIEDTNVVDKNGSMAINQLLSHTVEPHNFVGTSDITSVNSSRCVRKQVLTALLGDQDNSFINRWGGELDIDGLTFKINKQIGSDKGYKIKYGKNLTGLNYKTNMNLNKMATKIRPVGFDGISLNEKYVISSKINDYPMPIIREIKYENVKWKGSPNFETREDDDSFIYENLSDAQDKLRELAQKEFENGIDLLDVTLDVDFIELSKTEEYKNYKILETIELGDTVTLEYAPLGIYTKQRCVEYELDVLTDQYNSIVLGDCEPNFFNETNKVIGEVADAVISGKLNINGGISDNKIQEIISDMTEIMTNYLSGYVVITNNEILIMDTDDKETAQNVWRFNSAGIAHSSTGYNGTYTVGMTMDGHINGRIISANTIMGESMVANTVTARELAVELNKKIEDSQTKEQVEQIFAVGEGQLKSFISNTYETKTEVDKKVNNLSDDVDNKLNDKADKSTTYTKQEVNTQISQAQSNILLGVSGTYETKANVETKIKGISVGGTNLAFDTNKGTTSWRWSIQTNSGKTITEYFADGIKGVKMTKDANDGSGWNFVSYGRFKRDKITPATTYVVSFEMKSNKTFNVGSVDLVQGDSNNTLLKSITAVQNKVTADSKAWSKIIFRLVTLDTLPTSTSQVIYITGIPNSANATHYFRNLKLEVGNTPTAWSPAPDDVASDINTAKNNAIASANSTLTSTIANYYTKSETDSKIKIAKDAIDLSVSNTYETKENTTSKINSAISGIQVGGTNRLSRTDIPQTRNINMPSGYDVWDTYFTPNKQTLKELGFKIGDQITLGFNWNISKNGSNDFVYGDCRAEMARYNDSGYLEYIGVIKNPIITFSSSNTSGRSEATVTLTHEMLLNMVALRLRIDNSVLTLTISDVKLEKGTKATSWSPAPEDVKSDITSLESETSSIKQTVTSIQLGTDNINATVKSLSETLTTSNQNLAADIASVQNQVNMAMTSDEVKMEIKKELVNGVNKVTTSTGYVFDQNGLSISKSGSEMETKITEDGMKVFKNDEVMLTANNQGVDAKNLHATTYLIIGGNSRMEDFKHGTEKRTAVFWIG